jgi:hypothetical protein
MVYKKGDKVIYQYAVCTVVSKIRGHDAYKIKYKNEVFNVLARHIKPAK